MQERFGALLRRSLKARGLNAQTFGEKIGVEASSVRRWLRSERIPRSHQFDMVVGVLAPSSREQHALRAAIKAAFENGSTSRAPWKQAVRRILDAEPHDISGGSEVSAGVASLPLDLSQLHVSCGRSALEITVALLETAAVRRPSTDADQILLTFRYEDVFVGHPDLGARFRSALVRALVKGWEICHFFDLDDNVFRTARLVESSLSIFACTGNIDHSALAAEGTHARRAK